MYNTRNNLLILKEIAELLCQKLVMILMSHNLLSEVVLNLPCRDSFLLNPLFPFFFLTQLLMVLFH
jgi:hypothetical protein